MAGLTVLAAVLRILLQIGRPFLGDEVGTLRWIGESYSHILSHFDVWLSLHYFLVVEKWIAETFGTQPAVLVALPFVFGVATVPLTAAVARSFLPAGPSLVAATLAACNPYLIHQSLNIRSYSALVALTQAAALLFFRWARTPTWGRGAMFAAVAFLLVLLHPNGVYPLLVLGLGAAWGLGREILIGERGAAVALRAATLGVPTLLAAIATALAYHTVFPLMLGEIGQRFHGAPPTGFEYPSFVWSNYFGPGFWGWPSAALFALGCWASIRHRRRLQAVVAAVALVPLLLSVQGVSHYPWAIARYLAFLLPWLLVIIAAGCAVLLSRFRGMAPMLLATGALVATWIPALDQFSSRRDKYPLHRLRADLAQSPGRDGLVLAAGWYTDYYLDPRPEPRTYDWVELGRLELDRLRARLGPDGRGEVVLVVLDAELDCSAPITRYGALTVVHADSGHPERALRSLRACLDSWLRERLPIEPEAATVYQAVLDLDRILGTGPRHEVYAALLPAIEERHRTSRWRTETMRSQDADRLRRRLRSRLGAGQPTAASEPSLVSAGPGAPRGRTAEPPAGAPARR